VINKNITNIQNIDYVVACDYNIILIIYFIILFILLYILLFLIYILEISIYAKNHEKYRCSLNMKSTSDQIKMLQ